jgi:hypothetical protein
MKSARSWSLFGRASQLVGDAANATSLATTMLPAVGLSLVPLYEERQAGWDLLVSRTASGLFMIAAFASVMLVWRAIRGGIGTRPPWLATIGLAVLAVGSLTGATMHVAGPWAPLRIEVGVYRSRDRADELELIRPYEKLAEDAGYAIYFEVVSGERPYVYVLQWDQEHVTRLFPRAGRQNPVGDGPYWLPGSDGLYSLDRKPSSETIYVLVSRRPLCEGAAPPCHLDDPEATALAWTGHVEPIVQALHDATQGSTSHTSVHTRLETMAIHAYAPFAVSRTFKHEMSTQRDTAGTGPGR